MLKGSRVMFYLSVIHIWRRGGLNQWRIRHRSRPHHWSKSGIPQTDQTELQKREPYGEKEQREIQVHQNMMEFVAIANYMLTFRG